MNIFGLLAVVMVCVTIFFVVHLITTRSINVKHICAVEEQSKDKFVAPNTLAPEVVEKAQEPKPENAVATASMDAVIAAANNLMGIETITKENADE